MKALDLRVKDGIIAYDKAIKKNDEERAKALVRLGSVFVDITREGVKARGYKSIADFMNTNAPSYKTRYNGIGKAYSFTRWFEENNIEMEIAIAVDSVSVESSVDGDDVVVAHSNKFTWVDLFKDEILIHLGYALEYGLQVEDIWNNNDNGDLLVESYVNMFNGNFRNCFISWLKDNNFNVSLKDAKAFAKACKPCKIDGDGDGESVVDGDGESVVESVGVCGSLLNKLTPNELDILESVAVILDGYCELDIPSEHLDTIALFNALLDR